VGGINAFYGVRLATAVVNHPFQPRIAAINAPPATLGVAVEGGLSASVASSAAFAAKLAELERNRIRARVIAGLEKARAPPG